MRKRKNVVVICLLVVIAVLIGVSVVTPGKIADPENYTCGAYATVFALLPPVVAIGLALITKKCILRCYRNCRRCAAVQ